MEEHYEEPVNVSNESNATMFFVDVDIGNVTMNVTPEHFEYNTTTSTSTTMSGPSTTTSTSTTTCTNCTTTSTQYQWTTVTTTITTTLAKLCETPYDPAGNYTLQPF